MQIVSRVSVETGNDNVGVCGRRSSGLVILYLYRGGPFVKRVGLVIDKLLWITRERAQADREATSYYLIAFSSTEHPRAFQVVNQKQPRLSTHPNQVNHSLSARMASGYDRALSGELTIIDPNGSWLTIRSLQVGST